MNRSEPRQIADTGARSDLAEGVALASSRGASIGREFSSSHIHNANIDPTS
jgi:hypothetical protein